jgi:hypothetical protein
VPHEINNEIGPALFKLSKEYVQIARAHGFEFGQGDPLHRLAVFILKSAFETNTSEPDWKTLCLSNYIHQDKSLYTLFFYNKIFLFIFLAKDMTS